MRYGIFAVSPVLDSSEAERRQANRAYPPPELITFPKFPSDICESLPASPSNSNGESLTKLKKEITKRTG
jgi:hypothetical protein